MAMHRNTISKNTVTDSIAEEVLQGLNHKPKFISSKFLYDEEGSRLFEKITTMPSYYLYNAEYDILERRGSEILEVLPFSEPFSILEFGAGDGSKTIELLKHIQSHHKLDSYIPVDISAGANGALSSIIDKELPDLSVTPVQGNYFDNMKSLIPIDQPVLLMYLGSNIGNFQYHQIRELICAFGRNLKSGDAVLIGFDLRKNPLNVRRAYDDPEGITRTFNMNLLTRFNRELVADFDLDQFDFYSYYHPESGEVRSYLVSLKNQKVNFADADQTISFGRNELIHTEISKKFNFGEIRELIKEGGFEEVDHWLDSNNYFTDVLAVKR